MGRFFGIITPCTNIDGPVCIGRYVSKSAQRFALGKGRLFSHYWQIQFAGDLALVKQKRFGGRDEKDIYSQFFISWESQRGKKGEDGIPIVSMRLLGNGTCGISQFASHYPVPYPSNESNYLTISLLVRKNAYISHSFIIFSTISFWNDIINMRSIRSRINWMALQHLCFSH